MEKCNYDIVSNKFTIDNNLESDEQIDECSLVTQLRMPQRMNSKNLKNLLHFNPLLKVVFNGLRTIKTAMKQKCLMG